MPNLTHLASLIENYLNESDSPTWAGDDCRTCDQMNHADDCAYLLAQTALEEALKGLKGTEDEAPVQDECAEGGRYFALFEKGGAHDRHFGV